MSGKFKIGKIERQSVTDEIEEPVVQEGQVVADTKEGSETGVSFKPREEMERVTSNQSSISIPEFILGEPYPYFYHTWNKLLLCILKDVAETFHINNSNDLDPNIYVFNNDLKDDISKFSDFETQHKEYGNSLQNYYTIVKQTTKSIDPLWKDKERIDITSITPIYLQKCENIMTTLFFMPLDQCHDFRGGRTSGSTSWVTEISKGVLKKDVNEEQLTAGITADIYSNNFMNTLVKTSFSGKQGIVGIMVIGDYSFQLLNNSAEYKTGDNLNIQKIIDKFAIPVNFDGNNINMNCDPRGNRLKLSIEGEDSHLIFLGFTSDGWDKGMHDVWSMNEIKHVYSIKIDSITQLQEGGGLAVKYSGDKVTVIENIVPCYEMIYKSKDENNLNAFINNFEIDGKKITKKNVDEFFTPEVFDKLYSAFLAELYRRKTDIVVEEDDEEEEKEGVKEGVKEEVDVLIGGAIDETKILRGATYKFYGVRAPDSKASESLTPENRGRHIIFENMFIEILKKISKNISPQIHPDFKYPDVTNILCDGGEENLNERIKKVNNLYETIKNNPNNDRIITKQFGTVNDMNIAPVIEKVMESLNCSDNCNIVNVERTVDEEEEEEEVKEEVSLGSTTAASESGSDSSVLIATSKKETKKKEIKSRCQTAIETNIEKDLNNKYPFKFQVVSGVLDSSLQGGENMPEYFPPEMDIFMTIFDNQGNLQGAVIRMTFLKVILKNTTNSKNNARVFSHFIYVDFDEINLECEAKLGTDWKINPEKYPFALKQLINYTVNNTSFLPSLTQNLISNFELRLKDETFKRWYFYFSDTAGPSVSEGINDVVKKIFSGALGIVSDDNVDVSESIVKVAQKIYMGSEKLKEIFTREAGLDTRSYAFESTFLLRIKYIGDKSRCTDSLFLNRNKYAECMQITGDENAYFTALINGASTIYSPPSKFAMYFAPYFTYGDVEAEAKPGANSSAGALEPVGKFLMNSPIYKETLLKGESPTEFKISSSSSRKKTINTELAIPFESLWVKERGALASGVDVRDKANEIIKFVDNTVNRAYADAQLESRKMAEAMDNTVESKRNIKLRLIKKALDGYLSDYNELKELYDELTETVNRMFIYEIEKNDSASRHFYYNKIIEQLRNIFDDNDFIIEPVVISEEDFARIKKEIIDFIEKALKSMKAMSSQPYSKGISPQMLDINGDPDVDNSKVTQGAYDELNKNIPVYESLLTLLKQTEDVEEFYNTIKDINDFYNNKISTMSTTTKKVIFWDENIDKNINFIFSLSDIMNHILPNIKTAKSKFASQTNKYGKFITIINQMLEEINILLKKKPKANSAPPVLQTTNVEAPSLSVEAPSLSVEAPSLSVEAPSLSVEAPSSSVEAPNSSVEAPSSSVIKAKKKIGRQSFGGGPGEESYRKNQIYILKCFSDLIKTNNSEYEGLITPDKLNFNYKNIKNINDYCVSILMLQAYYSLNSFQPKLKSLQDITDKIETLNEDTSTLQDAINIRNYYSQIIDTFINIEYIQEDSIDFILSSLEVDITEGDTVIYDVKKLSDSSFYLITFVLTNLNLISSGPDKFVNNFDDINYRIMSQIHSLIGHIDREDMNNYYKLSKSREEIDKIEEFTQEEKTNLLNKISIAESYEYLCLFLIKYCNNFLMKITNSQLVYSKNGLIYNYETIKDKIGQESADKFESIKINIGNSDKIEASLFNFNDSGNLKNDLESINNILLELSTVSEIEEVPLKDIGEGLPKNFSLNLNLRGPNKRSFKRAAWPGSYRELLGAGTSKNKKIRNDIKTRNNKTKNKKGTIKKRENKFKRYTRRT
jgi:hypothetical protein